MSSVPPGSPASASSRAKCSVTEAGAMRYSSGSTVGLPAGTSTPIRRTLTARDDRSPEPVVGHSRHAPDEVVGGGEAWAGVGERFGDVLGVGGEDEERALALED